MQNSCLLLALLPALRASGFTDQLDCAKLSSGVNLLSNASHVLRTWQNNPAADCNGAEAFFARCSPTKGFPPCWVVMQLRRPMLVERVSVQSCDGVWQTTGLVDSRLSAFGAASLPLDLQLEDPCRASLQVLRNYSGWRKIENAAYQTSISFVLLTSTVSLNFLASEITGHEVPLMFNLTSYAYCAHSQPLCIRQGDDLGFSVTSCGDQNTSCVIKMTNARNITVNTLRVRPAVNGSKVTDFEFVWDETSDGVPESLLCSQGDSNKLMIEKVLGIAVDVEDQELTATRMWIAGRSVTVKVISRGVFPQPKLTCKIISGSNAWNLNLTSKNVRRWKNANSKTLFNVSSDYEFNASMEMLGGQLSCLAQKISKYSTNEHDGTLRTLNITLSAPCLTEVDLGSSPYWLEDEVRKIRVTSRNCSIWSVEHTCWLDGGVKRKLEIINKTEFTSIHQLHVSRWMGQNDWRVRCRVNQSGVLYDDVVSKKDQQPDVFYKSNISISDVFINFSHVFLEVSKTDRKPPVDNIRCQLRLLNSSETILNISLNHSKPVKQYFYDGPISANMSFWTNMSSVLVNCCAQQMNNKTAVFEPQCSNFTYLRPLSYERGHFNDTKFAFSDLKKYWAAGVAILCLVLVVTLLISTVRECRGMQRHSERDGQRSRRRISSSGDNSVDTGNDMQMTAMSLLPSECTAEVNPYANILMATQCVNSEFVTVTSVRHLDVGDQLRLNCGSETEAESDSSEYLVAVGHYEAGISTFVQYNVPSDVGRSNENTQKWTVLCD